jgi:WD40 repeat protein
MVALPTSTLILPTAAPTRTSSALSGLQVPSIVLAGHSGWVANLVWSPDGKVFASASGDYIAHDKTARLWKSDGTPLAVLSDHTGVVYALAWSPDGTTLATGSADGTVRLWQPDGTPLRTLKRLGTVFALAWSPDGQALASGSSYDKGKNPVQLWRPAEGKLLQTLYTDDTGGKFYNLAWSPDGGFLAAGALDYKLWRKDGTEIFHYFSGTPGWALAWSPDTTAWVIGNESAQATEFDTTGNTVATLQDPVGSINSLAWSPDRKVLVGGDGVTMWSADGTRVISLSDGPSSLTSVAWSPDGLMFAVGFDRNYGRGTAVTDHAVGIWNANGKELALLTDHADGVLKLAWSPDGKILASGYRDHTIRLWILPESMK